MSNQTKALSCTCGQVALEVQGTPSVSAECVRTDCQNTGAFLQSLPGGPPMLDQKGATRFRAPTVDYVSGALDAR
jgi:hypothetical protein